MDITSPPYELIKCLLVFLCSYVDSSLVGYLVYDNHIKPNNLLKELALLVNKKCLVVSYVNIDFLCLKKVNFLW